MGVHIDQRTGLPARYIGGLTTDGAIPEIAFSIPTVWYPTTWNQMSRDEQRFYGMHNPMPFFDWWPGLGKAVAAPADVRSRLRRAWRELCTGEL